MNSKVEQILYRLQQSKFRNRFHLKDKDILYLNEKGLDVIQQHAYDFVKNRIAPREIKNDGKQTPMRGHPVFIAQHATATCCRECLWKWHKIAPNKELTKEELEYIMLVIMTWIEREYMFKH